MVNGNVGEGRRTYDGHFLSGCLAESFGPSDLSWVAFHPGDRKIDVSCSDGASEWRLT